MKAPRLLKKSWPYLVLCAWPWLLYFPVLLHSFGYNDDYSYLVDALERQIDPWRSELMRQGRYLTGPAVFSTYRWAGDIDGLAWMRALSLLGWSVFGCLLYRLLRRRWSLFPSVLTPALVLASPAAGVYTVWALVWPFSWGAALALAGGACLEAAAREPLRGRGLGRLFGGGLLLLLATTVYQPLLGLAVVPWLQEHLQASSAGSRVQKLRQLGLTPLVMVGVAGLYFLIFRWVTAVYFAGSAAPRAGLSLDLLERLRFFGQGVLPPVFSWWAGLAAGQAIVGVAAVLGSLLLVGLLVQAKGWRARLARLGIVLLALPLAFLPVLASSTSEASHRVMFALYALVALLAVASLCGGSAAGRSWRTLGVLGLTLAAGFAAHHYVRQTIVEPNRQEVAVLREAVGAFAFWPERMVYHAPSMYLIPFGEAGRWSEYHMRASAIQWAAPALFTLLFREHLPNDEFPDRRRVRLLFTQPPGEQLPVIHGFALLHGDTLTTEDHPFWGPIQVSPQRWAFSEVYGSFDLSREPVIFNLGWGWMHAMERSPDGSLILLFYGLNQMAATNRDIFPRLILLPSKREVAPNLEVWAGPPFALEP